MWLWVSLSIMVIAAAFYWKDSQSLLKPFEGPSSSLSATVIKMGTVAHGHAAPTIQRTRHISTVLSETRATAPPSPSEKPGTQPDDDIFRAAAAGRWKDVSKFLQASNQATDRDSKGFTPLHHAAAGGDNKTIDLLLKYGRTGWFGDDHISPLHLAARYGHTTAVKQILEKFPELEKEKAAAPHSIRKLKESTKHKFNIQFDKFFSTKTFTARELAAIYGHQNTVLAFSHGAKDGLMDALSCACLMGDANVVLSLWNHYKARSWIHRRRDPARQVPGFPAPPLHLAVMSGNRNAVAFLLEEGVEVNDASTKFDKSLSAYSSPAHYAAVVGSVELLKKLEHNGAKVTSLDRSSRTPLSYAVENLNVDVVEFLVRREHPDRGFTAFGSRVQNRWLGSGHVWPSKEASTAARPQSNSIAKALKPVGLKM